MKYVLGADIGSGSVKLTLLSQTGELGASAACEYPTQYPQAGWAQQDPEDWCRAFHSALNQLLRKSGVTPEQIVAVAPDAATHTAVLLDKEYHPVAPAILWTDQRSSGEVDWLKEHCLRTIREQTLNTPTAVWTLPQMMWIKRCWPKVWNETRHILFAKDYLRYRLTKVPATDTIDAMGSMFYNAVAGEWSSELCNVAGIPEEWLPRLLEPTDLAGTVTPEAAAEFGLAEGTQVLTGTSDTAMEMLAAGNVVPGDTTVKLATAGRICVVSEHGKRSPFLFNYRHVVPGLWYPGTATSSCAASYRWYRDTLGNREYEELDRDAAAVPPGSEGLIFHPHLQGELTPYNDPALRGSYVGITSHHTAAHFTRATLEGIALSLRDCMSIIEEAGMKPGRFRIIGGGAKSALWRQIVADVLGVSVEKAEVDDSSFGSAMLAAVGIGWFSDFREAARKCVKVQSVTAPRPESVKVYRDVFERYKKIHEALQPLYH